MGISIMINNMCEIIEKELLEKYSPEEIKRMRQWHLADDEDAAFKEYSQKIELIENKYSIELVNGNFFELCSLLNFNEDKEFCGEISGYELIELKIRAEALLNTIRTIPEQFTTETEEIKEEGRAILIIIGKDYEYWERKVSRLIELIDMTDLIYWA